MEISLIESGQIVNTHGIQGEVKIQPWCDSPEFLCGFDTIYIDGTPRRVLAARIHKGSVLAVLEGVTTINDAMLLKGKIISVNREKAILPEGRYFIADLIGLTVISDDTNEIIGKIYNVDTFPANDVYVIRGEKEYMVPAVKEFIKNIDIETKTMRVHLIPGMCMTEAEEARTDGT